jgi:hypothetical protein
MVNRREALQWTAAGVALASSGAALAFEGRPVSLRVEPRGDIQARATVWLDDGVHRICVWHAAISPVPSIPPAVEQTACRGVLEVEVEGVTQVRRAVGHWRTGRFVSLPGTQAGLWIGTPPDDMAVG